MTLYSLPTLYKYAQTGAVQEWTIFTESNKFFTVSGQQGGKLTTSAPTVCKGKNIGRSNETTPEQQAEAEARAKWQKKVDEGYNEVLSSESKFFEPMLAHDAKKCKLLDFKKRTFVQPKLDGLRADNHGGKITSRNGKPYVSTPHLEFQSDFLRLDGELYNHELKEDFNKIVSLCKKQKPTKEELEESKEKVQYWVYDFPSCPGVFSKRYNVLEEWFRSNPDVTTDRGFVLVETFEVFSMADIEKYHEYFIEQGYEGTIVRIDLADYENKRSWQLLKYKDFIDEEFEICGYEEGEGGRAGTIGKFYIKHEDGIRTFKSNVKGDFDYLRQVWKDREMYIGKQATIKYFRRTPDGIPRFPYVIKLNREEYE